MKTLIFILLLAGVAYSQPDRSVLTGRQKDTIRVMIGDSLVVVRSEIDGRVFGDLADVLATNPDDKSVPVYDQQTQFWSADADYVPGLISDSLDAVLYLDAKRDFGAVGDGVTDDTEALQNMLNYANYTTSNYGVKFTIPTGQYKVTRTLVYQGSSSHGVFIEGETGTNRSLNGATFVWHGKPKGVVLYLLGINSSTISNIQIRSSSNDTTANGSVNTGIWVDATNSFPAESAINIDSLVLSSNWITVYLASSFDIDVTEPIRIAGLDSLNGTFLVDSVISSTVIKYPYMKSGSTSLTGGTATRVKSSGASGLRLEKFQIGNVGGYNAVGIRLSRATAGLTSTPQISEIFIRDFNLSGDGVSNNTAGIRAMNGGNAKNFTIRDGSMGYFDYGVDASKSAVTSISHVTFTNMLTAVIRAGTGFTKLNGVQCETTSKFITGGNIGTNAGSVLATNCVFQGQATDTTDIMIDYSGTLTLIGNLLVNNRTGSSEFKIRYFSSNDLAQGNNSAMLTSIGNWYRASSEYIPVYDNIGENRITDTDNIYLMSTNDLGGIPGSITKLNKVGFVDSTMADRLETIATDSTMYGLAFPDANTINVNNRDGNTLGTLTLASPLTVDGGGEISILDNFYLTELSDDVTPSLSGMINLNGQGWGYTADSIAAGVAAGEVVYLDSSVWRQADFTDTTDLINIRQIGIYRGSKVVQLGGIFTTTGLTAGLPYYGQTVAGTMSPTKPTGSGNVQKIIGFALSSTLLRLSPDSVPVVLE